MTNQKPAFRLSPTSSPQTTVNLDPGIYQRGAYQAVAMQVDELYAHRVVARYCFTPLVITEQNDGLIHELQECATLSQLVTASSPRTQSLITAAGRSQVQIIVPNRYPVKDIGIFSVSLFPDNILIQVRDNNTEEIQWTLTIQFEPPYNA